MDLREEEDPQILVETVAPFVKLDSEFDGKVVYVRIPKDMGESTERLELVLKTSPDQKA